MVGGGGVCLTSDFSVDLGAAEEKSLVVANLWCGRGWRLAR